MCTLPTVASTKSRFCAESAGIRIFRCERLMRASRAAMLHSTGSETLSFAAVSVRVILRSAPSSTAFRTSTVPRSHATPSTSADRLSTQPSRAQSAISDLVCRRASVSRKALMSAWPPNRGFRGMRNCTPEAQTSVSPSKSTAVSPSALRSSTGVMLICSTLTFMPKVRDIFSPARFTAHR